MCDLVGDITAIDESIEVSKYVLKYNCGLPCAKYEPQPNEKCRGPCINLVSRY